MKISLLLFVTLFLLGTSFSSKIIPEGKALKISEKDVYNSLDIPELNKDIFDKALSGYYNLWESGKLKNKNYLTIVDFTKPSNRERLFLIDLKNKKLVDKSLVAHGRNSGNLNASSFSNNPQSYQSSLGFYTTAETYNGQHGFSLRLDGVEKNINDKARERAIVIHGAEYVSHEFCQKHGRLGRSFGCPSLPTEKSENIISSIKNNSCLFIYYSDKNYLSTSKFINLKLPDNWWSNIFE